MEQNKRLLYKTPRQAAPGTIRRGAIEGPPDRPGDFRPTRRPGTPDPEVPDPETPDPETAGGRPENSGMTRLPDVAANGRASGRLHLLDSLRGLCLLSMLGYHAMYDLVVLFGHDCPWYFDTPGHLWQQSICWGFILLSGFCYALGRSPVRHGLTVLAASALVSLATALAMPSQTVRWGVLFLLGAAPLVTRALQRPLQALPPAAGLAGSAALFFVLRNLPQGSLGFEGLVLARLPAGWYSTPWLSFLGLPGPGFASSDYFPLLPWLALYWAGFFAWRCWGQSPRLRRLLAIRLPGLAGLGRRTLPVYLLHQPVTYGLFWLIEQLSRRA